MDDQLKQALSEIPDKYRNQVSAFAYMAFLAGRPINEVTDKTHTLACMLQAAEEVEAENDQ